MVLVREGTAQRVERIFVSTSKLMLEVVWLVTYIPQKIIKPILGVVSEVYVSLKVTLGEMFKFFCMIVLGCMVMFILEVKYGLKQSVINFLVGESGKSLEL